MQSSFEQYDKAVAAGRALRTLSTMATSGAAHLGFAGATVRLSGSLTAPASDRAAKPPRKMRLTSQRIVGFAMRRRGDLASDTDRSARRQQRKGKSAPFKRSRANTAVRTVLTSSNHLEGLRAGIARRSPHPKLPW